MDLPPGHWLAAFGKKFLGSQSPGKKNNLLVSKPALYPFLSILPDSPKPFKYSLCFKLKYWS